MPDQYLSPTPQEPVTGGLAAALQKVLDYANKSGTYQKDKVDNPVLPILADFLMIPQAQRTLEKLSYGDKSGLYSGLGQTLHLNPDAVDTALAAVPLAGALRKAAVPALEAMPGALAGSRTAQRGAITAGGDPDLMPWHGTSAGKLLKTMNGQAGVGTSFEFSSPSIGISRGGINTKFAQGDSTGGVLLIPRVGAYDPATSTSTLFNRDAYTPRSFQAESSILRGIKNSMPAKPEFVDSIDELAGTFDSPLSSAAGREAARLRQQDRLTSRLPSDLALREGKAAAFAGEKTTGNWAHDEVIKGSPVFRSFQQFERSPLGAALLQDQRADADGNMLALAQFANTTALNKAFGYDLRGVLEANYGRKPRNWHEQRDLHPDQFVEEMQNALRMYPDSPEQVMMTLAAGPQADHMNFIQDHLTPDDFMGGLRRYRGLLKRTPSEYAELKVHGPTEVGPENWAGAIMLSRPQRVWQPELGRTAVTPGRYTPEQADLEVSLGIPTTLFDTSHPETDLFRLAQVMQQAAGPARKHPLGSTRVGSARGIPLVYDPNNPPWTR